MAELTAGTQKEDLLEEMGEQMHGNGKETAGVVGIRA